MFARPSPVSAFATSASQVKAVKHKFLEERTVELLSECAPRCAVVMDIATQIQVHVSAPKASLEKIAVATNAQVDVAGMGNVMPPLRSAPVTSYGMATTVQRASVRSIVSKPMASAKNRWVGVCVLRATPAKTVVPRNALTTAVGMEPAISLQVSVAARKASVVPIVQRNCAKTTAGIMGNVLMASASVTKDMMQAPSVTVGIRPAPKL